MALKSNSAAIKVAELPGQNRLLTVSDGLLLDESSRRLAWRADSRGIDRERIIRGLSQKQLARVACVDPGTLSDLLNGRRRPQLGTVSAIARALELALPELVEFD